MSDAPLYDAVLAAVQRGRSRFHTPGHAGREGVLPFPGAATFDLTEIPGLDALYEASGPILEAEKRAAQFFHAARTCLSAGGCTLCIQAMLSLAAQPGQKVILSRNAHRAAVYAAALLDLEPIWLWPVQGRCEPEEAARLIAQNPDVAAVYITSPDYCGRLSDIPGLAAVCRNKNIPLLVDNAHGSHLGMVPGCSHPLAQGAAMTACSAHKTLPVLTGGAWLNIADAQYAERAKDRMALFGSTSPSYLILVSLDLARCYCEQEGPAAFARLAERVARIKKLAQELGFSIPQGPVDPVRITLETHTVGRSAQEAAAFLREEGVEPEWADHYRVVLLPSPFHQESDFIRVEQALRKMPKGRPAVLEEVIPPPPARVCSVREALLMRTQETVSVLKAQGRVAGQPVCPCPPGIPVVMPGEVISREAVECLSNSGISWVSVLR